MAAGQRPGPAKPWVYDLFLWIFSVLIDLFFREVHPRSSWKVPKSGPVIFVAAPHANQFVDPLILMRLLRLEAHRRVSFLIAEKSLKRPFIGWAARTVGAVGVGRAMDSTKPAPGKIYLPDPDNEPTLIRGVGTDFQANDFQVGGLVVLPSINNESANAEIGEIVSAAELRLKKPFKSPIAYKQLTGKDAPQLNGNAENGSADDHKDDKLGTTDEQIFKSRDDNGTSFKIAPKVDQAKVYDQVFEALSRGSCVGIFPEGGSHDRTELLPLKAGVAIMALGTMAANPDCGLKIVPVGMNYFNAHKFRSRAVVEFGTPLDVPKELVEQFKSGDRRTAIGTMLDQVYNALISVTVTSPDYDTLMLIQAVRRLYNPKGKPLPLPMVVELNRRLVKGYTRYRHDPRIINLKANVLNYHRQLMALNVRDHQLHYAKLSVFQVVPTLIYRIGKLIILTAAVLPGVILFAPVFIAGKVISIRKAREALAASTVKVQARDVIATWKILVSMALAPTLYTYYTVILTFWTYYNRVQGYMPESVPLWAVVVFGYIFFPAITFAALRFGEAGMDIAKSLRPLVLSLNPTSGNTLVQLRQKREQLATEVTNLINELGPEMFPDFDSERIIQAAEKYEKTGDRTPDSPGRGRAWSDLFLSKSRDTSPVAEKGHKKAASLGGGSSSLPRNESYANFGSIGLFASRPQTPTHGQSRASSRSGSRPTSGSGFFGSMKSPLKGFSMVDSKEASEDVSQKIRGAMRERGQRRSEAMQDGYESSPSSSGLSTPAGDGGGMLAMTDKKNL